VATPKSNGEGPPGWLFYQELLRTLREDVHSNRIATRELSEVIRSLDATCHSLIEELRVARGITPKPREAPETAPVTSKVKRLSDRKGYGEKRSARRQ
jgi:hypothetical protein